HLVKRGLWRFSWLCRRLGILVLYNFLLSWIADGQCRDGSLHPRNQRRRCCSRPDLYFDWLLAASFRGCLAEYHWAEYRQMVAECWRRGNIPSSAHANGGRLLDLETPRSGDPFLLEHHQANVELGYREFLVPDCFCFHRAGAGLSDER